MKLRVAALVLVAMIGLAACGSSRGRTVELPGGVLPEEEQQNAPKPNLFDRLTGHDVRPNEGPCPLMGVLYDTSRLVQFSAPNNQHYANIAFTGEMEGVHGLCRYVDANPITMSIDVDMQFGRGPSGADRKTYRYWVAVTQRGRRPLAKEYYTVDVTFPHNQLVVAHTEHIEQITIPRANATVSGENFEILVGFDLTPDQLQFNRDGRRFRIDAGSNPTYQQSPAGPAAQPGASAPPPSTPH